MYKPTPEDLDVNGLCTIMMGGWSVDYCSACIIERYNRLVGSCYTSKKVECPDCRQRIFNRDGDSHPVTYIVKSKGESNEDPLDIPEVTCDVLRLRNYLNVKEAHG